MFALIHEIIFTQVRFLGKSRSIFQQFGAHISTLLLLLLASSLQHRSIRCPFCTFSRIVVSVLHVTVTPCLIGVSVVHIAVTPSMHRSVCCLHCACSCLHCACSAVYIALAPGLHRYLRCPRCVYSSFASRCMLSTLRLLIV